MDVSALEDWASKPASSYVVITPNDAELEELFEYLARNISKPGATNITIIDKAAPCFQITAVSRPLKGTFTLLDDKRVALAVILTEVDQAGNEYNRGMKTGMSPAPHPPSAMNRISRRDSSLTISTTILSAVI